MATIKSFTDISQSRKLAEILPLDSADMWYSYYGNSKYNPTIAYKGQQWFLCQIRNSLHDDIPCWSLAALLGVLPFPVLYMEMVGGLILWSCESHLMEIDEVVKIEHYDNPVDACYEMIIKLNELKML